MVKYTQVMPVVDCSDKKQLLTIMNRCGVARALTYNKLGSLQGWGMNWHKADSLIRAILHPNELDLPSKLFEWSVSDCFKAITAQQEAAKTALIRKIYQKYPVTSIEQERKDWCVSEEAKGLKLTVKDLKSVALVRYPQSESEQKRIALLKLLYNDPTSDPWLHRHFRHQYIKGHTYLRNQVVYQSGGYKAARLSRYRIKLEVQGLKKGRRITLIVKTHRLPVGQIRVIDKDGQLESHTAFEKQQDKTEKPQKSLGMDKGYSEGFYLSDGRVVAPQLGEKLTRKTERINKVSKNRSRLYHHALNHSNHETRRRILSCNLGRKVQNRQLQRDKNEIKGMLRQGLRQVLTEPTIVYAEELSSPIKSKVESKRINRKLNQWMKGELQLSLEEIGQQTGSTVTTVNAAYTSQIDHLTGTLLGSRKGDRFYRYNGDVLQSDRNAANVILSRGTDSEITRYMKYQNVRQVLLHRTVRYLHSLGYSVADALNNGWLSTKFKSEAIIVESEYPPMGYRGRLSSTKEEYVQLELPLWG
jgi:IS605 OrfB family transposase